MKIFQQVLRNMFYLNILNNFFLWCTKKNRENIAASNIFTDIFFYVGWLQSHNINILFIFFLISFDSYLFVLITYLIKYNQPLVKSLLKNYSSSNFKRQNTIDSATIKDNIARLAAQRPSSAQPKPASAAESKFDTINYYFSNTI